MWDVRDNQLLLQGEKEVEWWGIRDICKKFLSKISILGLSLGMKSVSLVAVAINNLTVKEQPPEINDELENKPANNMHATFGKDSEEQQNPDHNAQAGEIEDAGVSSNDEVDATPKIDPENEIDSDTIKRKPSENDIPWRTSIIVRRHARNQTDEQTINPDDLLSDTKSADTGLKENTSYQGHQYRQDSLAYSNSTDGGIMKIIDESGTVSKIEEKKSQFNPDNSVFRGTSIISIPEYSNRGFESFIGSRDKYDRVETDAIFEVMLLM